MTHCLGNKIIQRVRLDVIPCSFSCKNPPKSPEKLRPGLDADDGELVHIDQNQKACGTWPGHNCNKNPPEKVILQLA